MERRPSTKQNSCRWTRESPYCSIKRRAASRGWRGAGARLAGVSLPAFSPLLSHAPAPRGSSCPPEEGLGVCWSDHRVCVLCGGDLSESLPVELSSAGKDG